MNNLTKAVDDLRSGFPEISKTIPVVGICCAVLNSIGVDPDAEYLPEKPKKTKETSVLHDFAAMLNPFKWDFKADMF